MDLAFHLKWGLNDILNLEIHEALEYREMLIDRLKKFSVF